jgi:hypothetical protein
MNFMVNPLAFIWGWFIPHKDGDDLGMVYKKRVFHMTIWSICHIHASPISNPNHPQNQP